MLRKKKNVEINGVVRAQGKRRVEIATAVTGTTHMSLRFSSLQTELLFGI